MESPQCSVRLADGREFGPAPMEMIVQWAREGRVPWDATLTYTDGSPLRPVMNEPTLAAIVRSLGAPMMPAPTVPPTVSTGIPQPVGDESLSVIVPYRNP